MKRNAILVRVHGLLALVALAVPVHAAPIQATGDIDVPAATSSFRGFESLYGALPVPEGGIYYDRGESGWGLNLSTGVDGTVFGIINSYGEDGRAETYVFSGRPEALPVSNLVVHVPHHVFGGPRYMMVRTETFRVLGGTCLGCAFRAYQPLEPGPVVNLTFDRPGQLWLSFTRQPPVYGRYHLQRVEIDRAVARQIEGRFALALYATQSTQSPADLSGLRAATVRIRERAPLTIVPVRVPQQISGGPGDLPASGSPLWQIDCESHCSDFAAILGPPMSDGSVPNALLAWIRHADRDGYVTDAREDLPEAASPRAGTRLVMLRARIDGGVARTDFSGWFVYPQRGDLVITHFSPLRAPTAAYNTIAGDLFRVTGSGTDSGDAGSRVDFATRHGIVLPESGNYFDRREPGWGFTLDVGVDGTAFGVLNSYAADGRTETYVWAAPFLPVFDPARSHALGGPRFRARAMLDQVTGGPCAGCPWHAVDVAPSGTTITVDYTGRGSWT